MSWTLVTGIYATSFDKFDKLHPDPFLVSEFLVVCHHKVEPQCREPFVALPNRVRGYSSRLPLRSTAS